MADQVNLECWQYDFSKRSFVLVMSNRRKWLFRHIKDVLQCDDIILQKMFDLCVPNGSMCEPTSKLFRFLSRKFYTLRENFEEEILKIRSWEYIQSLNKVHVTYENDQTNYVCPNRLVESQNYLLMQELIDAPMTHQQIDVDAVNFKNLIQGLLASWLDALKSESEESDDEDLTDGSGYTSEPWTDF